MGVFGLCNSLYDDDYNKVAKTLHNNLLLLGAVPLIPLGLGDNNVSRTDDGDLSNDFNLWMNKILIHIAKSLDDRKYPKNIVSSTKKLKTTKSDNKMNDDDHGLADMEDIGNLMKKSRINNNNNKEEEKKEEIIKKEMVTKTIRQSLTKQGYKVIGSHSGVKLCRWTKSMLRGRGGCYKHTFYGIKSYQCMEMT
eukprot:122507_1